MPGSREERGLIFVTILTVRLRVKTIQFRSECFEEVGPLCRVSEIGERHYYFKSNEDVKGKRPLRILHELGSMSQVHVQVKEGKVKHLIDEGN